MTSVFARGSRDAATWFARGIKGRLDGALFASVQDMHLSLSETYLP